MRKAVALVTCLMTLGPATALADSYRYTERVVGYHHTHSFNRHHGTHALTGKSHREWGKGRKKGHRSHRDQVAYGRVVSVEPVYRVISYSPDRDTCLHHRDDGYRTRSYTSTVLGAVIGATVGHRLGDHHGDPGAAAIAGGVLGASLGRDVGNHIREGRQLVVRGPCRPAGGMAERRELVEYVVRYRYNGEVYRTRTDYDPGEWIALDVDINPA